MCSIIGADILGGGSKKKIQTTTNEKGRRTSTFDKKQKKRKKENSSSRIFEHTTHNTHTTYSRDLLHYFIPLVRCCLPSARRYLPPHPGRRRVKRSGRSAATMGEVARGPWACTHRRRTTSEETISGSFY